jgi:molecular chaperone HscB
MKCECCNNEPGCRLLCDKCGQLFVDNKIPENPFDLFHLPCRFNIDEKVLEKEYLELSKEVHPDHHRDKPQEVQTRILNLCSKINCAYKELRCPFNRARIILEKLAGKDFVTDNKFVEPAFLMRILDLQEELENEKTKKKKDLVGLQKTEKQLEDELEELFALVGKQFNELSTLSEDVAKAELAHKIQINLNKTAYYRRLLQNIERILEDV